MLLYDAGGGSYVSGLDGTEWNTLWAYERDFAVRQAVLYTSYGTWPENYCLNPSSETSVGDNPLQAALTPAGATVFDDLKTNAVIPVTQSYVYRTRVAAGCAADPILKNGNDVLGVRTTSTDGRERAALTFTSNQYLMQTNLLAYGLFRWASRGLYLGDQRHYLEVDVDDWFNSADHYFPDGHDRERPGLPGLRPRRLQPERPADLAAHLVPAGLRLHAATWPSTAATRTWPPAPRAARTAGSAR